MNVPVETQSASGRWRIEDNRALMGELLCSESNMGPIESKVQGDHSHWANNLRPVDAALDLYDKGFNILPITKGKKQPVGQWASLHSIRLSREVIEEKFHRVNVGVIAGRLSHNLFVIDCDDKDSFRQEVSRLEALGLAKWVVSSPHGGHIWLLSEEGVVKNHKGSRPEVWGDRHYVLFPPSVNVDGELYQWLHLEGELPPSLNANTLLEIFPYLELQKKRASGDLPPVAKRVLVENNSSGYASNSEAVLAAARSLLGAGYDQESVIALLLQYNPPHLAKKRKPREWIVRHLLPKVESTEIRSKAFYMAKIAQYTDWAERRPWPHRTGIADQKVFLACCQRAAMERINNFRASRREIAELADVGDKTASRSLNRLCEQGFLERRPTINQTAHFAITAKIN